MQIVVGGSQFHVNFMFRLILCGHYGDFLLYLNQELKHTTVVFIFNSRPNFVVHAPVQNSDRSLQAIKFINVIYNLNQVQACKIVKLPICTQSSWMLLLFTYFENPGSFNNKIISNIKLKQFEWPRIPFPEVFGCILLCQKPQYFREKQPFCISVRLDPFGKSLLILTVIT